MTTTETHHGFYCPCDECCGWEIAPAICDYGGGDCPKPATHETVTTRPDGEMVERRPMCLGHATYAAMIYAKVGGNTTTVATVEGS